MAQYPANMPEQEKLIRAKLVHSTRMVRKHRTEILTLCNEIMAGKWPHLKGAAGIAITHVGVILEYDRLGLKPLPKKD